MARPRKVIDPEQVELLARAGCSAHSIAASLGVGEMTIKRRFGPRLKGWQESAVSDLKVRLMNRANDDKRKDSTTCMIFYLKNYGGMRDNIGLSSPEGGPVEVEVKSVRVDL